MQQLPEIGEQGITKSRVISALMSLSTLALRTSALHLSPPEVVDRLAVLFLDQLVSLCEAQQGALFLLPHRRALFAAHAQGASPTQLLPMLIARTGMSVEEARAALASAVVLPGALQWPGRLAAPLAWKRSPSPSPVGLMPGENTISPDPAFSALFLLLWPEDDPSGQQEKQQRAVQLLPFLADLVDTILMQLYSALDEERSSGEVFPADLLATVGHEFRGPLTTIQGYATTLQHHEQHLSQDERQEFLHAISTASAQLGKLIDYFLTLAQLETHSQTIIPAPVNLPALVQEAITAAQQRGTHHLLARPPAQRSVGEGVRGEEALPHELTLFGDRRLLRLMLDILLENALAYSAPESLVEVSIEPLDAASVHATLQTPSEAGTYQALILPARFQEHEALVGIQVRDHGIGIEPIHLPLIFRRFYRVDTRLTRDVNGLGLGLTLCKEIVALHRGMLRVESAIGEGSTFSLVFPCGKASGGSEGAEAERSRTGFEERMK